MVAPWVIFAATTCSPNPIFDSLVTFIQIVRIPVPYLVGKYFSVGWAFENEWVFLPLSLGESDDRFSEFSDEMFKLLRHVGVSFIFQVCAIWSEPFIVLDEFEI